MQASMTVQELAREACGFFETRTRDDSGEAYVTLKDDAPDWLHDLVREAHGDFLPDDWRYQCIRSAIGFISDNDGDDLEDSHEFADAEVDMYNGARTAWLSSNLNRAGYVDEAVSELGYPDDIYRAIGYGQYFEAQEVFASVVASLEAQAANQD